MIAIRDVKVPAASAPSLMVMVKRIAIFVIVAAGVRYLTPHSAQVAIAEAVQAILGLARMDCLRVDVFLVKDATAYAITPECALLDLTAACVGTYVFTRWDRSCIWRIILLTLIMIAANPLRIAAAILGHQHGTSWFVCHDVPNVAMWLGSICLMLRFKERRCARDAFPAPTSSADANALVRFPVLEGPLASATAVDAC
ncbi:MAG TPA: hypothetical protein VEL07_03245 [Planctomycetota bacterium]|nr:hypothetical protein [Planctomycetota bacterium]